MTVTVITSVYGDYDQRSTPPPQTVDAEWICVTDVARDIPGWQVVVERRPDMHPRLAAKVPKCLPWLYTGARIVIWIDGSCQLLREDSIEQLVRQAAGHPISQFVHPWRDCIYDEADASVGMLKYEGRPIREQVEQYRGQHPDHWGLWATGLIVRDAGAMRPDQTMLMDFGAHWLAQQVRWTYQDQLSEAVVLRAMELRPHELEGDLHGNGLIAWANHRDES